MIKTKKQRKLFITVLLNLSVMIFGLYLVCVEKHTLGEFVFLYPAVNLFIFVYNWCLNWINDGEQ